MQNVTHNKSVEAVRIVTTPTSTAQAADSGWYWGALSLQSSGIVIFVAATMVLIALIAAGIVITLRSRMRELLADPLAYAKRRGLH